MKVLLVEPPKAAGTIGGEDFSVFEPLALEYLAAGLKADHDVRILDMRLDKDLDAVLDDFNPGVVGLTGYTAHVNVVRRLCDRIKQRDARIVTVVGGHHATIVPIDFHWPSVDVIVIGEGVATFRNIIARLDSGRSLAEIPGIALPREDGLTRTDPVAQVELDDLPFPARTLTAKYRKHYFSEWMKPLASIRTSKGCPNRCNFCALWKIAKGRYYKRSPASVVAELADIEERNVFFADDESLIDTDRMAILARRIEEAGLRKRYFLYGRSDTIAANPELLESWRKVGLARVFVGLEFCRDEDLAFIDKGSTIADNARAVRILQELGIDIYASFILRPEFTRDDFRRLRDYCHELHLDFAAFAVLTPLPGTDLYESVKSRLIMDDFDRFDFFHTLLPTALPVQEFYSQYLELFRTAVPLRNAMAFLKRFPLRDLPSIIAMTFRFQNQLKRIHLDYAQCDMR